MKKIGLAVLASFASLSASVMTAHAAVQTQSQTAQVQQGQRVSSSQNSQVNETNNVNMQSNQVQSQPGTSTEVNSMDSQVENSEASSSNMPSGGTAAQGQTVQLENSQQQTGSGTVAPLSVSSNEFGATGNSPVLGNTPSRDNHHTMTTQNQATPSTNIASAPSVRLSSELSEANAICDGPTNAAAFHGAVTGYAVFDLQGNEISDNQGTPGNGVGHFDDFQPNQPVVLLLMPVGSNGKPVQATRTEDVYLKSNDNGQLTVDGHTFDAIVMKTGSFGVPFVYTNTGSSPSFSVIDEYHPRDKHRQPGSTTSSSSGSTPTTSSSQSTIIHANQHEGASSVSGTVALETQQTTTSSKQSQDNISQTNGESSKQSQEITTNGSSTLHQQQTADVQTNSEQTSNTSTDANGTLHIQLDQAQSLQSKQTASATENQSTTFGATGSMEIDFNNHQQTGSGEALQSQSIGVTASGSNGSSGNSGGKLSVYVNGNLSGSYNGVSGSVTASQSQTAGTNGTSSDNKQSDTVTYEQDGKSVTVKVG